MAIPKFTLGSRRESKVPPPSNTSKEAPRLSPLDIPEVLERILSFLDRSTITLSIQLVCRQWRLVGRHLYHHPLVFDDYGTRQISFEQVLEKLPTADSFQWTSNSPNGAHAWVSFKKVLQRMDEEYRSVRAPASSDLPSSQPLREFHVIGTLEPLRLTLVLPFMSALTSLHINTLVSMRFPLEIVFRCCPELLSLHLECLSYLLFLPRHDKSMSSINLARDSQDLLEPSCIDKPLRLESLTIKKSIVTFATLVDILAVCSRLQHLALIALSSRIPPHWVQPTRNISQDEFLQFLPKACPQLHKIHYSDELTRLGEVGIQSLIHGNLNVSEWGFLLSDLTPSLARHLCQVRNVVTYLEISLAQCPGTDLHITQRHRAGWLNLDETGLHAFLCSSPLLLHLKTDKVWCSVSNLELFPNSLGIRDSVLGATPMGDVAPLHKAWACSRLETLSLYFFRATGDNLDGIDSRLVFGYLSRVCPMLKHLFLGFDDMDLDLQSGMCLLSRMYKLETVTLRFHGRYPWHWLKHQDWTWMDRQDPTPLRKLIRTREFKTWDRTLKQEKTLIQQRELYLKHAEERYKKDQERNMNDANEEERPRALDLTRLGHHGTLTDVRSCLREMASKGKDQRWPRLEWIQTNTVRRSCKAERG